jgi:outer membrane protein assembly factor BamB
MAFRLCRAIGLVCAALAFLAACPGPCARAEDWPRWRGPRLDGISRETGLLKEWPKEGLRQLWKAPLSGGFSSVAVADGFVFTQTKQNDQEVVICLDAATGKDVWRYRYDCDYAAHKTFTGGGMPASRTGPRATPAVDAGRVYALGATGILLCLEAKTGKKVWQQDLLKLAGSVCPRHGYCGSPLVVGDRVYVEPGGPKGKSVAALNKKDGSVVWQALDDPIGQSSPVWAEVGGVGQVIFFTGAGAVGVAPADGHALWRFPWKTTPLIHIATPLYADGQVFISSDYGTGGAVFRLKEKGAPETVWNKKTMQNHLSTSVLYEGHLYGVSEGRLRCLDFRTGEVKWNKLGLGRGWVIVADGHLIALGDHGELFLAKATPKEYVEVSRCTVLDPDKLTWSAPVVSGGRLYIRNENALVALDLTGKEK